MSAHETAVCTRKGAVEASRSAVSSRTQAPSARKPHVSLPGPVAHAEVVAELRAKLLAFLDARGTIDAQQWKDLTGASRKFTIPIAEYFDAEKLTVRRENVRVLRGA